MSNGEINLNKLIDVFVENSDSVNGEEEDEVIVVLKTRIREIVEDEVKAIYRDELEQKSKEKLEKEKLEMKEKFKINTAKTLLIDTVIFSGIVGLLVNQVTDIVSFLKGYDINVGGTAVAILVFLMVIFIFVQYAYIKKIDDYFSTE